MNDTDRRAVFAELISRHQSDLYAYIFAMVRNWEDSDDLYQSVCLLLWSKFESFRLGSSFFAWARQTAKITVRNFLKQRHWRNQANDKLLDVLADAILEAQRDGAEPYLDALRRCKGKLNTVDHQLLELRYAEELSSGEIADRLQRPQPSVCHSLTRIRQWLLECIQVELFGQEYTGKEHS
jgi:RNA polymerase sigma-70 factor, ECF subfamily